ncbi:MAG TPA: winged helix-turn-helix domain-containing protein [Thermoanaerobaculia bacterium]|jgi:DNA-binding winged helix-turn-helix (wHTH) protein/TolB-like protein
MTLRFEGFELTAAGELRRDGAPVHLQPQPSKVLALLAARAGELVTREELQRHVWGEETFVDFDQSLNWCIRRIREALGDDASKPRFIQTVPRRGYRFIADVAPRVLGSSAPRETATTREPEDPRSRGAEEPRSRYGILAASLLLALLVGGVQFREPSRISVLVLPFDNLGGAAREDAVATEEVITALARIDPRRLAVIDPLTARKFQRSGECIIKLGQQLNTEYVLLGAVRPTATSLRVTAQLFRVADNRQTWAAVRELPPRGDLGRAYESIAGEVAAQLR